MKLKLNYIQFSFVDADKNEYYVICEDATRGNNVFKIYKNGNILGSHQPQGGNVNKTTAKYFLLQMLKLKQQ